MSKKSGSHHKSGSKPKKSYPPEVREKAVKLITELGYSVGDVAEQLGCSKASVHRWQTAAVLLAYRRCSQGMMQTTLICSFGLLVFAATSFIPMIRFGLCMFALLMLSYLFTMLLLPAILCSPVVNYFAGRQN